MVIKDYDLFDLDIYYWRFELNIDLPHFPELISRIDEHLGREICYLQETQDYLIGSFLENWETKRADALQRRAKDPDFEYKPWMDRPDDYIGGKAP